MQYISYSLHRMHHLFKYFHGTSKNVMVLLLHAFVLAANADMHGNTGYVSVSCVTAGWVVVCSLTGERSELLNLFLLNSSVSPS